MYMVIEIIHSSSEEFSYLELNLLQLCKLVLQNVSSCYFWYLLKASFFVIVLDPVAALDLFVTT